MSDSCPDVCAQVIERLLTLEFPLDTDTEDHAEILNALGEVTFTKTQALVTLLNCAEADLIGLTDGVDLQCSEDEAENELPALRTIRELHEYLLTIDPDHKCSLNQDEWDSSHVAESKTEGA